ncbi:MAG: aminotransferase class I/II-fold pyridoxal phosphate-dependent enzyme [Gammaproteobacteria bacterium]
MRAFPTRAVHSGRSDLRQLGVHALPLDLSTTYPLDDLDQATASLDQAVAGEIPSGGPVYARLHNPTVGRFETALADLENTEAAVAFGSGMAAITACLMAARQRGSHIVAVRPLYGTTDHLLNCGLLGLEVSWTDPADIGRAIRPDTGLIIVETPANPTLQLIDIRQVVQQAGHVPVLVDSTFATPVLQRPADLGASLVVHSATKFLGGHGDVIAGVVATDEAHARALRQVRLMTGGLLHPLGAYLLHRGLATLPVRVERAQQSAMMLARRLCGHPQVRCVHYPGTDWDSSPPWVREQMQGPGAILAFELAGGHAAASTVMKAVRIMTPAVSLGSVDTLIQHPAGLTHRVVSAADRAKLGIGESLLRVSVGLEDPEDLWGDLDAALAASCVPEKLQAWA